MNICVFCSAQDVPEKYGRVTYELGELLGRSGHALVWGGSYCGLMKIIADGVRAGGGKLCGVSIEVFKHKAHQSADEMVIAKTLGERKALMLERSDVVVGLPGGLGTLDEVTEILALRRHGKHDKKVVMLNTDQFYEGFLLQLRKFDKEGFLIDPGHEDRSQLDDYIYFAETPAAVVEYINQHGVS